MPAAYCAVRREAEGLLVRRGWTRERQGEDCQVRARHTLKKYPQVEQNATQLSRCDVSTSDEGTSASAADSGAVGSKGDVSDDLARLIATWPTLAPEVKANIIALAFGTGAE